MRTIDETDLKQSKRYYPLDMSKASLIRFNDVCSDTPIESEVERVLVSLDEIGQAEKYIKLQPREVSADESHSKDILQDMRAGIRHEEDAIWLIEDTSGEYEQLIIGQGHHRIGPIHSLGYKRIVANKIKMNMQEQKLTYTRFVNFFNDFAPRKSMKLQDTVKSYLEDIKDKDNDLVWTNTADCENEIRKRRPSSDPTSIDKIVNSIETQLGTYQSGLFRSLGKHTRKTARLEAGLPEDVRVAPSKYLDKYIDDRVLKDASGHDRKERLVIAINADKALTMKQLEIKRKDAIDKVYQQIAYHDAVFKKSAKGKTKELTELGLYPLSANENHPLHRVVIVGFLAQFKTEANDRVIRTNTKGETIETLSGMEAYNADTMIPIAKDTKNVVLNETFNIEDKET